MTGFIPNAVIDINEKETKFVIRFDYEPSLVKAVKELTGRKWVPDLKVWITPVNFNSVTELETFVKKNGFRYTPPAKELMIKSKEKYKENIQDNFKADTELDTSSLKGELRPFQKVGVKYALKTKRLFIADEMGTGKSCQSIATVHLSDSYPCIIVCPATLKLNWEREFNKWVDGKKIQVISSKDEIEEADVHIINYDILNKKLEDLKKIKAKAIIFDESQMVKGAKSLRGKAAKKLAKKIPMRLALTGTPILSKPKDLINQLAVIGRLDDFGGFYPFATRYCDLKRTYFGLDISGASHLEELNKTLRATCYIRREKSEVLKELPPKQRSVVPVEIDNIKEYKAAKYGLTEIVKDNAQAEKNFHVSISKLSKKERKEAIKARSQDSNVKSCRAKQLTQIGELKQLAAKGKMKNVIKWTEDFLESGEKLVVFAYHKKIVKEFADHFKCNSITGDTPMDKRQEYIDEFQNNPKCKIMILNIRAGGVGITLTAASNVAFIELDWTPASMDQCEDRCHRIGTVNPVNAWYLLGTGTIDEEIYELIEKKRVIVNAATDGEKVKSMNILNELIVKLTSA